jgi:hypothetical protein
MNGLRRFGYFHYFIFRAWGRERRISS